MNAVLATHTRDDGAQSLWPNPQMGQGYVVIIESILHFDFDSKLLFLWSTH